MKKGLIFASATAFAFIAASIVSGCDEATKAAGDVAKQCGLECPEKGVAEGNATISGVASIDSFFGAVVDYNSTVDVVVDSLATPLANIKAQLKLDANATPAQVIAKMKADFGITGDIKIVAAPPSCEVSAKATVEATAKCDASVEPGSVKAECSGRCEADVKVSGGQVSCEGSAKLNCTAPSVNVACSGSCKGECKLDASLSCEGTCKGSCDGTCEVKNTDGTCNGKCDGKCGGTCELSAGGKCSGTCSGECAVEAQGGSCSGDAKVECFAEPPSGSAKVTCEGKCEGEITPPKASVECEASAKASAELRAECTPPSVEVTAELAANASVETQAKFDAFMGTFKTEMGALLAGLKRADIALRAGANVVARVPDVTASFKAQVDGDIDLKTSIGLGCAIEQLDFVVDSMKDSTSKLSAQAKASGEFVAAFK
jgi:hypothetical protein